MNTGFSGTEFPKFSLDFESLERFVPWCPTVAFVIIWKRQKRLLLCAFRRFCCQHRALWKNLFRADFQ